MPRPWPRQPPRGASVAGRPSRARRLKSSKAGALRARQAGAWGISALCPQARPSSEDASRRRPSGSKAAVVGAEECALIRNGRRRAFGIPTMASFDPPECREESGNLFGGSRFFLVLLRAARCVFGQFGCRQVNLFPEKNHAIMITASSVSRPGQRIAHARGVWCLSVSLASRARACRGTRSHLDFVLARFHTNSRSKI